MLFLQQALIKERLLPADADANIVTKKSLSLGSALLWGEWK
jgi:hypothetical protein